MFKYFTARGLPISFSGLAFLFSCRDNKNNPAPTPKGSDASTTAISVSLGGETYNVPVAGGTSTLNRAKNISKSCKTTAVNITKGNEGATGKVGTKNFTNGDVPDFTKDVAFNATAVDGTLTTYVLKE